MSVFACLLVISVFLRLASGACEKQLSSENDTINYKESKVEDCSWMLPNDEFFNDHTLILKLMSINLRDDEGCAGTLYIPGHGGECDQKPGTCYGYSNNALICNRKDADRDYKDCNELYWRCSNKRESYLREIRIRSNSSKEKSFNLSHTYFSNLELAALPSETIKEYTTTIKKRHSNATMSSKVSAIQSLATDTTQEETSTSPVAKDHSDDAGAATSSATSTTRPLAIDTTVEETTGSRVIKSHGQGKGSASAKSTIQSIVSSTAAEDQKAATTNEVQRYKLASVVIVVPVVIGVLLVISLLVVIWMRRTLQRQRKRNYSLAETGGA